MTPIEAITAKLRIALNGRAQSVTCGPALCRAGQRVGNEIDAAIARNRSRHRTPRSFIPSTAQICQASQLLSDAILRSFCRLYA